MSKFICLLFIMLCSCATKVKNISNNNASFIPEMRKLKEKEFFKYNKENNTYTLKLNGTEPFTFSLKHNDKFASYKKLIKENTTITEASQSPLIKAENNPSIENYILNTPGTKEYKISNLKISIDRILKKIKNGNPLDLSSKDIKEAFEKSFGNYFSDIYDLNEIEKQKKIDLLKTLSFLLSINNVNKFLQSLHIEKTESSKDTIFLNGKSLNNFNYFDFGIWEQDVSIKYNGNTNLKKYFDLKDENKHKFIPFIYVDEKDKIATKSNTSMTFIGTTFAGVKSNNEYKVFHGKAKLKIDNVNKGTISFDFNNWAKFGFTDIDINNNSFKEGQFKIENEGEGDFKIPNINNLKIKKLNGSFYGKDEATESAGIFKIENIDKSYSIDGVFGVKKN